VLTSGVYAILRLGYDIIPPLRPRLAPRLALDLAAGPAKPLIHFHASSVGEISSIAPVVSEAARAFPGHALLVTTMTATGMRRAAEVLPGTEVRLLPFDFKPAMQRFVRTLKPAVTIIAETELWPNLLREARRRDTSLVLVNGRISTKSIRRYLRLRRLVRSMLSQFDLLLMRSAEDADRAIMLGADPERVVVTGNTKYDVLPGPMEEERRRALKERLGLAWGRPVIILGSARDGETEVLLRGLEALDSGAVPAVVIAPRHLENVPRFDAALRRAGYTVRLSAAGAGDGPAELLGEREAIMVNEMGRLLEYYAVSDIAVLGGTFAPHGGHNPLEPASQGAVVVVGPYRDNIADDMEYLMGENGVVITDGAGLGGTLRDLIADPARMEATAQRASCAVRARKGASLRSLEAMKSAGVFK